MAQSCFDMDALSAKFFSVEELMDAFDRIEEGDPTKWGLLSNGVAFSCFGAPSEEWRLVIPIYTILELTKGSTDEVGTENVFVIPMRNVKDGVVHCTYASIQSEDVFRHKTPSPREIALPH